MVDSERMWKVYHRIAEEVETERQCLREGVQPETSWRQNDWAREVLDENTGVVCGTAMCFAGWTCVEAGGVLRFDRVLEARRSVGIAEFVWTADGDLREIADWAEELLGLDEWGAAALFHANMNSDLGRLRDTVERLAGPDPFGAAPV